jgi:hypothetical protein
VGVGRLKVDTGVETFVACDLSHDRLMTERKDIPCLEIHLDLGKA